MRYSLKIGGMGCRHCVARVTKALNDIGAAVINVEINSAVFEFGGDAKVIVKAIEELGFNVISVEAV